MALCRGQVRGRALETASCVDVERRGGMRPRTAMRYGIVLASYPMKNLQRSEQASPHLFIVSISSSPLVAGRFVAIHHPLSHRPPLDEVERALGVSRRPKSSAFCPLGLLTRDWKLRRNQPCSVSHACRAPA
ncbi:Os02g0600750 [Oryza sativa Japonica Group]|uniref:Os02g0600750 protein n=1 Tax=Oryza sativa subsp. japonica TaxID=39947 RepID=A0A0P0VLC2_ORYSJ|nr:Os02g0600750 [Oryza sativa Japonica Group]